MVRSTFGKYRSNNNNKCNKNKNRCSTRDTHTWRWLMGLHGDSAPHQPAERREEVYACSFDRRSLVVFSHCPIHLVTFHSANNVAWNECDWSFSFSFLGWCVPNPKWRWCRMMILWFIFVVGGNNQCSFTSESIWSTTVHAWMTNGWQFE